MKRTRREQDLMDALEMARGWIDQNREDESTGEGQQAAWILDSIDSLLGAK